MILGATISSRIKLSLALLMSVLAAGCATTSGSTRLDDTGQRIADSQDDDSQPTDSAYYIRALNGGLVSQIAGLKLSKNDKARALEAEYKALLENHGFKNVEARRIPDRSPTPQTYSGKWFKNAEELRDFKRIGALLLIAEKPH